MNQLFTIRVFDPLGTSAFQESLFRQRPALARQMEFNALNKVCVIKTAQ